MSMAVILRQEIVREGRGRLAVHKSTAGKNEWKTDKFSMQACEAEASRARFRDDHATYCVYCGIFRDMHEVVRFVQSVNRGNSFERAFKELERARVDVAL